MMSFKDLVWLIWLLLPHSADSTEEAVMLEISNLLRSDSRSLFSSDALFFKAHDNLLSEIRKNSFAYKSHPFVISLFPDCIRCHDSLMRFSFTSAERYRVISANTAIFYGQISEIESMRSRNLHSIKHFVPLLPEAKIDIRIRTLHETSVIEGGCMIEDQSRASMPVRISVIVAPMSLEELDIFKKEVKEMEADEAALFDFNFQELEANSERSAHVMIWSCTDVIAVAIKLSNRREVLWIERSHEIRVSNKWCKGITQSGVYSETPMYNGNLTGKLQ